MTENRRPSLAIAVVVMTVASSPAADPPWQFDEVVLANGAVLQGLILEQTPAGMRFQNVRRTPGRPAVVFTTSFTPKEIATFKKLKGPEREKLVARLHDLEAAGTAEKHRAERLELDTIPWPGKDAVGLRYASDFFVLESDAPEAVVRRAVVRLEQVFAAYARYLPPRVPGDRPARKTTIELFQSRAGYVDRLRATGRKFVNVACYDKAADRILGFSDLERLGAVLEERRKEHQALRTKLDKQEKELRRLYKGAEQEQVLKPIRATLRELAAADGQNEAALDQATRRLFEILGHEAFHAYLTNQVYPPPAGPPRWLDEGLAQVFETAVIEAGELRVGHADRDRLGRAKEAVRKNELVPLERLLRSASADFLAAHAGDRPATSAHYLTAWALAMHLTFERKLLGTEDLDAYFKSVAGGTDAGKAFADLVHRPLAEYEAEFHRYLEQLQPDGTLK